MPTIVFIDSEISPDGRILDLGAVKPDGAKLHSCSNLHFSEFVNGCEYICGHNIIAHDLKYVGHLITEPYIAIDTLYLSPLFFPQVAEHNLSKDEKADENELNNPCTDSIKAMRKFDAEKSAFYNLNDDMKKIFFALLSETPGFSGFFSFMGFSCECDVKDIIRSYFAGKICENADLDSFIEKHPVELAYCLSMIDAGNKGLIPAWVSINFPEVNSIIIKLRGTPCGGCQYCDTKLNIKAQLKTYFGFDDFRKYNGEPLQENAVQSAVNNNSLIAVFPTGGGKSMTFQLPALMAGEAYRGLTVVISPLQSLMKDQVDNLNKKNICSAATINGLLDPIERSQVFEDVANGLVSLLYLSPESLRSKSIEKLLLKRHISRFVIDEAHCFSSWGQDFRVDYFYIGEFIRSLTEKKNLGYKIPVSCFTATAKQKVISDIKEYFKKNLDIDMESHVTSAQRENLTYKVFHVEDKKRKYILLRDIISNKKCPTIVYVSTTRKTTELAEKLTKDGFPALPFNGKMPKEEKVKNQNKFMNDDVQIMVATSAFGMGVDKADVGLVVHYNISPTLEDYVQEAGRAGRNKNIDADCYILYNDSDLENHFMMLNQGKLSINEINQVWRAIKSNGRKTFTISPLELARKSGWDSNQSDIETKIKNAVNALENSGYVKRGTNFPRIFATSVNSKSMSEARAAIDSSTLLDDKQKQSAVRIIKSIISARSIAKAGNDEAETRVDYLADTLGIPKEEVIFCIDVMRQEKILDDTMDLTAYIHNPNSPRNSNDILRRFIQLEKHLLSVISSDEEKYSLKELNKSALNNSVEKASIKSIRDVLHFWTAKEYISKAHGSNENSAVINPIISPDEFAEKIEKREVICKTTIEYLYSILKQLNEDDDSNSSDNSTVSFSVVKLLEYCQQELKLTINPEPTLEDIKEALLYLSKIGSINIEGGFLVIYNAMQLTRLKEKNERYKKDDYKTLSEHYKHKTQQIHIVGEYAKLMKTDMNAALQFVSDYFNMEYNLFIKKYFAGERADEIKRNITPEKRNRILGGLSKKQIEIIEDDDSKHIVVTAGPGSGKTKLLVRKLARLSQIEDVKHEQLLMLTFSRAAATEFHQRLSDLINSAAYFIDIKTFHSYCFDLLGKTGSIEDSDTVITDAVEKIKNGEIEQNKITKTVLVIDEAQDMSEKEFELIKALMERNEEMRVIAVGDDDQNIYEFRGSSSEHLRTLITDFGAKHYSMVNNYRSARNIVAFANKFAEGISNRLKSEPISAFRSEEGLVKLIQHDSPAMETPIVECLMKNRKSGTTAILTRTNKEALKIISLLRKNNIPSKIIASSTDSTIPSSLRMSEIAETIYFKELINSGTSCDDIENRIVPKEIWDSARNKTETHFAQSKCLNLLTNMLDSFEKIYGTSIYLNDFEAFTAESKTDDFIADEEDVVTVSTLHMAKGREYDNVYIMLDNYLFTKDDEKRLLYVGITRAKNELYIHYNKDIFGSDYQDFAEYVNDDTIYPESNEYTMLLGYEDVVLGDFVGNKTHVIAFRSGDEITVDNNCMFKNASLNELARFSQKCRNEINKYIKKNYTIKGAKVRYVANWRKPETNEDIMIVLPELYLSEYNEDEDDF